jgi:hypothetical protein
VDQHLMRLLLLQAKALPANSSSSSRGVQAWFSQTLLGAHHSAGCHSCCLEVTRTLTRPQQLLLLPLLQQSLRQLHQHQKQFTRSC